MAFARARGAALAMVRAAAAVLIGGGIVEVLHATLLVDDAHVSRP
jgi:hypothetical protein